MTAIHPRPPANHDPDGFVADIRVHPVGDQPCEEPDCLNLATVHDVGTGLFFCDYHWLWCSTCGTGIFQGLTEDYCPKCHSQWFFKRKDVA